MLEKLEIGDVINRLRKEKGLTQEQLANFVGVSTPAVSKWESNICYPDITLLPTLARLFSVTIDELLNYNRILSKTEEEEILKECQVKLSSNEEDAIETCMNYIIKYPLNYKLKLNIAVIINMLYGAVNGEESTEKAYKITLPIFEEIVENCREKEYVEVAIMQLGTGYMVFKEYDKALNIFEKIGKPVIDTTAIIANIYTLQGREKEGRKLLQQNILMKIGEFFSTIGGIATTYAKSDVKTALRYIDFLREFANVLKNQGYPIILLEGELHMAYIYAKDNDVESCINQWKKAISILENDKIDMDISKVWFLNEIASELKSEVDISFVKTLLSTLESSDYKLIHNHKDYMDIAISLNEMI